MRCSSQDRDALLNCSRRQLETALKRRGPVVDAGKDVRMKIDHRSRFANLLRGPRAVPSSQRSPIPTPTPKPAISIHQRPSAFATRVRGSARTPDGSTGIVEI